jgi:hypothetical protein
MICVSEEDHLLYGNRLHVYGKDRSQTTNRFHDLLSELKVGFFQMLFVHDLT